MKIGMLVAVEMDAVFQEFGEKLEPVEMAGYEIYRYQMSGSELYVLSSGAGEIAAAAGTQLLITAFGVEMIVNFGVVGGLTEEMETLRTCVVERVVHYAFDTSELDRCEVGRYLDYPSIYLPASPELVEMALEAEPGLRKVTCASADRFVGKAEDKRALHQQFGADICEMEAAAVVLTCNRNRVPCLLLKAVSDSIHGGAEEFSKAITEASQVCLKVLCKVVGKL